LVITMAANLELPHPALATLSVCHVPSELRLTAL
jgi:hypothetical protein